MPTDPNMTGLIYPTEGDSIDLWGQIMNDTCWPIIGAHDHTTGKGVKIPSAALKINADVSWAFSGTSYALTDAKAIDFAAQTAASVSGYAGALFVNSDDANNLYFRTVGGTNVKITDGSTLNISIVGGIGGDYASIGALLDYDDASDTYRFRQETAAAVRQFAKIKSADLLLGEYKASGDPTVPTNFVTLKSPAALAASYTLTQPAALAGSDALLQATTAGVMSHSNTLNGTIVATDFRHTGNRTLIIPAIAWINNSGSHTTGSDRTLIAASVNPLFMNVTLPAGSHITNVKVFVRKTTNAADTIYIEIWKTNSATGVGTQMAVQSNSDNAPGYISFSCVPNIVMTAGTQYYLVFTPGGATAANHAVLHCEVTYSFEP